MTPEEIEKLIIYRDAWLLVLNKLQGLPVHKGFGGGITLDDYLPQLQFGLPRLPALAHRLDKDTSGCLVLGRHTEALRVMGRLFQNNQVKKTYWAIVEGIPQEEAGILNYPLAKLVKGKHLWHMKVDENGQEAATEFKVLRKLGDKALVELKPKTGRTHQLRVHCMAMGCPIMGDKIYGNSSPQGGSLMLHAQALEIPLHNKKPVIAVEAPLPEHINRLLAGFA